MSGRDIVQSFLTRSRDMKEFPGEGRVEEDSREGQESVRVLPSSEIIDRVDFEGVVQPHPDSVILPVPNPAKGSEIPETPAGSLVEEREKNKIEEYLGQDIVDSSVEVKPNSHFLIDQLAQELGLPVGEVRVRLLKLKKSAVDPKEVEEVMDTTVRISNLISLYQKRYGMSLVPVELMQLPLWVSPAHHGIVEVFGNHYYFPLKASKEAEERVLEFVDKCIKSLRKGLIVKESMFVDFVCEGVTYRTLRFSNKELRDIYSYLKEAKPRVVEIEGRDVLFVAGDYLNV